MIEYLALKGLQWAAYQITYDGLWRRTENYVSNRIIDSTWAAFKRLFGGGDSKSTSEQILSAYLLTRLTDEKKKDAEIFFLKTEIYHITQNTDAAHNAYIAIAATITLIACAYLFSLPLLPSLLLTTLTTTLTSSSFTQYATHAADTYACKHTTPEQQQQALAYFQKQKPSFYTALWQPPISRIKFLESKTKSD
ncbi:MAG: hypothetical protein P0S94_03595 [Simkaniaceae bacterium]|nr:hypothetical protein [Simkaniaceae bacterium]